MSEPTSNKEFELSECEPGDLVQVVKVKGENPVSLRLMEMGLVEGTLVRVVKRAPFGDPVEIAFRGFHMALRLNEASFVQVRNHSG